MKLLTAESL